MAVDFSPPKGSRLVCALGAGSMFEVAIVHFAGRRSICKRLRTRMLDEPLAARAMERERQFLALIDHPGVPELLASGADQRGPFLIQSAAQGASLAQLVRSREGALPAKALVGIMRAAFETLAQLHELRSETGALGLVHGDLAPDHVIVGPAQPGRVYFVDFGSARWQGMVLLPDEAERGSLPYVAPELARGQQVPSQACDVYALAACFAFALLGRRPSSAGDQAGSLLEAAERGIRLPPGVDGASLAGRVIAEALRFEASERLATARAVFEALRAG